MSRAPPPSNSAPPISKEMVEAVRRRVGPPSNPPPAGMASAFSAPKQYSKKAKRDEYDDESDHSDYDRRDRGRDSRDRQESRDQGRDGRGGGGSRDGGYRDRVDSGRDRGDKNDRDYDDDYRDSRDYGRDSHDADYRGSMHDDRDRDRDLGYSDEEDRDDYDEGYSDDDYDRDRASMGERDREVAMKGPPVTKPSPTHPTHAPAPSNSTPTQPPASSNSLPIAPAARSIFNFQPILRSTYRELRAFVTTPAGLTVTTRCYVERNRSGSKMLAPFFSLCADLEDGTGRELMVCRKVLRSRSAHYIFSLKSEDLWRKREQRSRLYLGKLRAVPTNTPSLSAGALYVLYDNGICAAPDGEDTAGGDALQKKVNRDRGEKQEKDEVSLYRRELACVYFRGKGTKGMEVGLPTSTVQGNNIHRVFERSLTGEPGGCLMYHEKATRYDPLSSCLVDFRGRAHMASVKNFQLVPSEATDNSNADVLQEMRLKQDADKDFILQMGKTTEDCFNMDYRSPLSLLQAFAICVARFDAKLSW